MKTKKTSLAMFIMLLLTALCNNSIARGSLTSAEMEAITGSDCPTCWVTGNPCDEGVTGCDAFSNGNCQNKGADCEEISNRRNDDSCQAAPDGQLSADCLDKACIEFTPGTCENFLGCICGNPNGNMPQAGTNTVKEGSGDSCF